MGRVTILTADQAPADAGPVVLRKGPAVSLGLLCGPAEGVLELPVSVCWSLGQDQARFDLADREQVIAAYEFVLHAAARHPLDVTPYLNAELLSGVWADLGMGRRMRLPWETVNPGLRPAPEATAA
jgi:hypothetical protein